MDNKKQYSNKDLRNILTDFVQVHTTNQEMYFDGMGCETSSIHRVVTTMELQECSLERFFDDAGCAAPPLTKMKTWYKTSRGSLFYAVEFSETGNRTIDGYGFNNIGNHFKFSKASLPVDTVLTEATEKEVLRVMIDECVRLGLVFGQHAECRFTGEVETINGCNYHMTDFNSNPRLWVESIRNGESDAIQLFSFGKFASKV